MIYNLARSSPSLAKRGRGDLAEEKTEKLGCLDQFRDATKMVTKLALFLLKPHIFHSSLLPKRLNLEILLQDLIQFFPL